MGLTAIRQELKAITGHGVKDEAIQKSLTKYFDPKIIAGLKPAAKTKCKQDKKTQPSAGEAAKLELVGKE